MRMPADDSQPRGLRRAYSAAEFAAAAVGMASLIGGALWLGALSQNVADLNRRVPSTVPPSEVVRFMENIDTRLTYAEGQFDRRLTHVENQLNRILIKIENQKLNQLDPSWETIE